MANDLDAIRKKVRRITRSPAESQLTTTELDEYINTFIVYDLPQRIQTINLRKNLAFFTTQLADRYQTLTITMSEDQVQIDNFDLTQDCIFTDQPMYIAGYKAYVTESREDFNNLYPHHNEIRDTGFRGDGAQTQFSGNLTGATLQEDVGILRRHVTITAQQNATTALHVFDEGTGGLRGDIGVGTNSVNYNTGFFDVVFSSPPANGAPIYAEFSRERLARPDTILLFNDGIYLRPIPDKGYRVELEAQIRPTKLIQDTDVPEIQQWWQYIAYGAAKKVFEDRMDMESVALIQPEMDRQERFALRNTILQAKKQRTATIYASAQEGYNHGHDGVM